MRLYARGTVCSKYFNCNYYVAYSSYMMRLSVNLLLLTLFVIVPRVQLGESLKTMIYADYPEQWPTLLRWVKHNLLDQQVYGILFVLRILSRKYAWVCDTNEFTFFIISVIFPFASVKAINANCTFLLIQNPVKSVLQEMVFMFLNLSSFVFSSFHGIMFVYVHMHVTISCI